MRALQSNCGQAGVYALPWTGSLCQGRCEICMSAFEVAGKESPMNQSSRCLWDRQAFDRGRRGGMCGDEESWSFSVSGHLNVDPFTLNQKSFRKTWLRCPHKTTTFPENVHSRMDGGGVVKCQGWLGIRPRVLDCGWQHSALIHTKDRKKK